MSDRRYDILVKKDRGSFIRDFNSYLEKNSDGYLFIVSPEDTFRGGRKGEKYLEEAAEKLACILDRNPAAVLVTPKKLFQFPNRMAGVMINLALAGDVSEGLKFEYKYNYEAEYLLRLIEKHPFMICQDVEYEQGDPGDGNYREFEGIYDPEWYIDDLDNFLIPLLKKMREEESPLSYLIQYYAMYNITCRLDANQNNNNRHVLSAEQAEIFRQKIAQALQYVDDDKIMDTNLYPKYKNQFQFSRMLLRFKKGSNDTLTLGEADGEEEPDKKALYLYEEGLPVYSSEQLLCNIQFMDYRNGRLEIDGSFPDIYDKDKVRYYFEVEGQKIDVTFCERYSLVKYFGISAYKRFSFHASVPLDEVFAGKKKVTIRFYIEYLGRAYEVGYEYKSHTSRLSVYPSSTYWHFGKYIATSDIYIKDNDQHVSTGIIIRRYNWFRMAALELGTGFELLVSFQMHRFRFLLLRMAWVITHPYFGRKNIWMFFDKIYKGGDSAEYLYKYASAAIKDKSRAGDKNRRSYPQKLYYLVDENATDYGRLKKEGYKPLKRGSFLHRLVFLNADVMVVSNSTVFAFNDYYLENSRYVRGIVDFHTVCVQHGLSVQKIALAQQRLRDNTRLYFCASKYEIENLSHPVYDYVGYDALKLTGVPRYDGLKDNDKKQIMISPTWRMQSAKFVSKNEGVERDYNPLFKETPYYKVYNSLINDRRLLDAAKEYGYRIAYVLHPIVSPQADDFDKNEFVDIIPAVGDMSYEKMFCESSLMITDYSGIQFDFAYMRKPLVYYHPEELEAHYEEGTFHYDTMAFGEIVRKKNELVELLIEYMKNGCEMKELYRMRADDFYEFSDHNNCERIFDEIVAYMGNVK